MAKKEKVVVYTAEWCPWCHRATDFLKQKGVEFEARDVDEPKYAQESIKISGQTGIPVIVIGKEFVVGFDQAKVMALLHLK